MMEEKVPAEYKDRKGWLVFFGIVEILIGAFCLLLLGVMTIGLLAAGAGGAGGGAPAIAWKGLAGAVVIYALAAAFFITVGIGSILARRWSRAIMLIISSLWLAFGILTFILMLFMLPNMFGNAANGQQLTPEMVAVVKGILLVFMFVLYILLPGVFILFYRSPHVKATCEARDPKPRWTDRPLPVLSLSLIAGLGVASLVIALFINVVPFFGTILTGFAAVIYEVLFGALLAWAAFELYHSRMKGWLVMAGVTTFGFVSWIGTLLLIDMADYYAALGYPQEQLDQMRSLGLGEKSPAMLIMTAASFLLWIGYLWIVRKSILATPDHTSSETAHP